MFKHHAQLFPTPRQALQHHAVAMHLFLKLNYCPKNRAQQL